VRYIPFRSPIARGSATRGTLTSHVRRPLVRAEGSWGHRILLYLLLMQDPVGEYLLAESVVQAILDFARLGGLY
jgi:hypothetical protein